MSDPRLVIGNDLVGELYMRFQAGTGIAFSATADGGSVGVGLAVTTTSTAGEITLVADGEYVLGRLVLVEADLWCTVQVGGEMSLPGGTGATLTAGKAVVGDLLVAAEGYVREVNTAVAAELGVMNGHIHDASDTAAVRVVI